MPARQRDEGIELADVIARRRLLREDHPEALREDAGHGEWMATQDRDLANRRWPGAEPALEQRI
jgi:hypothetical protein